MLKNKCNISIAIKANNSAHIDQQKEQKKWTFSMQQWISVDGKYMKFKLNENCVYAVYLDRGRGHDRYTRVIVFYFIWLVSYYSCYSLSGRAPKPYIT